MIVTRSFLEAVLAHPEQWPVTEAAYEELARSALGHLERLVEVRRRMIRVYYTFSDALCPQVYDPIGTNPSAPHWWICDVCHWSWRGDVAERHEPTCPIAEVTP